MVAGGLVWLFHSSNWPGKERSEQEAADLDRVITSPRQVCQWRRDRASQLLSEGQSSQEVAAVLGCSLASVDNWVTAWQQQGQTGLTESKPAVRALKKNSVGQGARPLQKICIAM